MHSMLLDSYHLALYPFHRAAHLIPAFLWRPLLAAPLLAALVIAGGARLLGAATTATGAALTAGLAALAGWAMMSPQLLTLWPPPPAMRLPGLAVIVLTDAVLRARAKAPGWVLLCASALLSAWWLRGAPFTGAGLANCMPIFLGLAAAFPLARRLAKGDSGWASIGAALALAGSLMVTGAAPIWWHAALVPAIIPATLLGIPAASPTLATLLVAAAAATLVAADRGRFVPIDAACLIPLLVWALSPRLAPRVNRAGPAVAGLLAAGICVGLAWAAGRAIASH